MRIALDHTNFDVRIDALDDLPNKFVSGVLARSAAQLKSLAPQATGQLARSGRHEMLGDDRGHVIFDTNYAADVHNGRKPGWVDVNAISDWVKVKGLPEVAAYPIASFIKKHGTKAQPWVSDFAKSAALRQIISGVSQRVVA